MSNDTIENSPSLAFSCSSFDFILQVHIGDFASIAERRGETISGIEAEVYASRWRKNEIEL